MNTAVLTCIAVGASATWVYADATSNKIGKVYDDRSFNNLSAGAWAATVMGLWIIGFPAYLISRSVLLERAKERPQQVTGREAKLLVLVLITGAAAFGMSLTGRLPACNSPEVVGLTRRIITDNVGMSVLGITADGLSGHSEQVYTESPESRRCQANLQTPLGARGIVYTVQWQNEDHTSLWVQIVPTQ